jgi:pimeloyl-ACP methyl ester carboxylesterase
VLLEPARPERIVTKPAAVLFHGMWSTDRTLLPIRQQFEAWGFACHSPVLPFHENGGDAAKVATQSHLDYAAFLRTYISSLNLPDPPILVGHSMGGLLAQLVGASIPSQALVLFAPAAPAGINGLAWSSIRSTLHVTLRWGFWNKSQIFPSQESANYALFNGLPSQRQQELFKSLVPESGRALFEAGFAFLDSKHATRVEYARITAPVLILQGGDDRIVIPSAARQLVTKYADATLKIYPPSGHWLFEGTDSPTIFKDVQEWLKARVPGLNA